MDRIQIDVTAHRSDTEPFRIVRLERVIGYVCALADASGNNEVFSKVASLNDYKGTLTVKWKKSPVKAEKEFFIQAWKSVIGDISDDVVHEAEE